MCQLQTVKIGMLLSWRGENLLLHPKMVIMRDGKKNLIAICNCLALYLFTNMPFSDAERRGKKDYLNFYHKKSFSRN